MTRLWTPISAAVSNSLMSLRYNRTKVSKLARMFGADPDLVKSYFREASGLHVRAKGMGGALDSVYVAVRLLRPSQVLETGVANGTSSFYLLQALMRNRHGRLHSIDAPNLDKSAELPFGMETGWLVPAELRSQWSILKGKSDTLMEGLLAQLGPIDVFYHDSDHSYSNMSFEFSTAWKWLKGGGILISDNIDLNRAFQDFCEQSRVDWVEMANVGFCIKPR